MPHVPPKKPWGGRFEKSAGSFADAFGASLEVDKRLWEADIRGSIAHAKMLGASGIISAEDADAIVTGLSAIWREIDGGTFAFDLGDEDIHMAIERRLIDTIGPAGGRLHTARSRNDQVATDMRLYAKNAALGLIEAACRLRATLLRLAADHARTVMPGYTHLQRAQPIVFGHHLLAYAWMLARDVTRLKAAYVAADALPLGSAALAGTTFPIDREMVAAELGFGSVVPNSLDAVSDRDFWLDLTYACAVGQTHLSRLCEELVVWSTGEFGFITLDDAWATGSSIMPQKKNPDFAELVRGKTGRVVGDLTSLLVMLKGLPLAYNKDMQEDKGPAFDAIDTLRDSLTAVEGMVSTMRVNADAMRAGATGGFMAATDLADHLVGTGMPFREAHEVVGRLVLACERDGRTLQQLTLEDLRAVSPAFGEEAVAVVRIDAVVAARTSAGGTAPERVDEQLAQARASLSSDEAWLAGLAGA